MNDTMRPLKGEIKKSRYAVVDIETKNGDTQEKGFTRPFLAGFWDGEEYIETKGHDCIREMVAFLCTSEHDGWSFYAHFGGNFDWLHFLPVFKAFGFKFEMFAVCSSIQMLHVKPAGRKAKGWLFLDSGKLLPMKLAKAAKSFGVSLKLEEHDLDLDENEPSWSEYLKQDCVSLYEVLERFHELVEVTLGGEVGITAASTAMKTFRRSYQIAPIQRHSEHEAFFRRCYYGGRVEIFRKSGVGLHYYDINSAYPYAMRQNMPVGELLEVRHNKPHQALIDTHIGFCWARVEVPPMNVPVLPVKHDGKLVFPVGRLQGYWSMVELLRAEELGCVVHWDRTLLIEGEPALRSYVDHLYQFRDKEKPGYDEGLAITCKLLMNSLYGKFGTKTEKEKIVMLEPGDPIPRGRPADPSDPDCAVWYVEEEIKASYIIPQIAAHITALARLQLHSILLEADKRGGLYYCDTDSIITTEDLFHLCGSALGGLKDEGEGNTYTGEFLQPKLYCLDGELRPETKLATKGFSKLSREDYLRVKAGEAIRIENLEKIGSMAKKQFSSGPMMRVIHKQMRSNDEKRLHLQNGFTCPIYLEQW